MPFSQASDAFVAAVCGLRHLRTLELTAGSVTDRGLAALALHTRRAARAHESVRMPPHVTLHA